MECGWKCTCRPRLSEFGVALGSHEGVNLEAMIKRI